MVHILSCIVYLFIQKRLIDMDIFKRLARGELTLAVTFWVFGVLFSLILGLSFYGGIFIVYIYSPPQFIGYILIVSLFIIDYMLSFLVLVGLFNILKNGKLTILKVTAFFVLLCCTVYSMYNDYCVMLPFVIASLSY